MNDDLIIDESNFSEYFRDCRKSKPEKGDVLATWNGVAELIEGRLKEDLVDLLLVKDKMVPGISLVSRLGFATQKSALSLCTEIYQDASNGMTMEDILKKVYKYQFEVFYYTKPEYVPKDNPSWKIIGIDNLDSFLDKEEIKMKVLN